MINEALDKIKKLYKENYNRQLSDNEAEEELSLVLFENAILQAQVFSNELSIKFGIKLGKVIEGDLLENITTLSFAMIFYYMEDKYENIKSRIIKRYKEFIFNNAGIEDKEKKNEYFEFLNEKISKYIMWLSMGNSDDFVNKRYENYKDHFVKQIISANYIKIDGISKYDLNKLIDCWISNIESSVRHFGLIPDTMEKGIYFLADKEGIPILWKNDKFFTEEEIQYYIKTGKQREKNLAMILAIFSEGWMALQYSKRHSLQDVQVGRVPDQKYWSYLLEVAKDNKVQKIVINPCIKDSEHECILLTYALDEISDFSDFESIMKERESFDGKCGYDIKELFNKK